MFIPTEKELIDLHFYKGHTLTDWIPYSLELYTEYNSKIELKTSNQGRWYLDIENPYFNYLPCVELYPSSIEDVKLFIKLFTNSN